MAGHVRVTKSSRVLGDQHCDHAVPHRRHLLGHGWSRMRSGLHHSRNFRLRKVIHSLVRCGPQPSNEIEDLAAKFLKQQFTRSHQVLVFKPLTEQR
jgi:hypothetical protein